MAHSFSSLSRAFGIVTIGALWSFGKVNACMYLPFVVAGTFLVVLVAASFALPGSLRYPKPEPGCLTSKEVGLVDICAAS